MNFQGLNKADVRDLYHDALAFFKADAERHKRNGRQVYSEEIKHHIEAVEEWVRRQRA